MGGYQKDEHGRIQPGSVPGWGASWWFHEQGVDLTRIKEMAPSEYFKLWSRYWKALAEGWEPPVPREQWVGAHHPSRSEPLPRQRPRTRAPHAEPGRSAG